MESGSLEFNQVDQAKDTLEASLMVTDFSSMDDFEIKEFLLWMDSFEPNKRRYFKALGQGPLAHYLQLKSHQPWSSNHYRIIFDMLILVNHQHF